MTNIKITVAKKRATLAQEARIVCGNSDYTVTFAFGDEWARYSVKTARFTYKVKGLRRKQEVVFSGNTCPVPTLSNTDEVLIGVYAGNLQTTTGAAVPCERSILCGDPVHEDPPEDVYNQVVELCGEAVDAAKSVEDRANSGEFDGEDGYTPQKGIDYCTPSEKAELVAEVEKDLNRVPVAPRAQVRQIKFQLGGSTIYFEDVFAVYDSNNTTVAALSPSVYGLEAHKTTSTTQRVFKSLDGGETWSEFASLKIDAANGQWFTSLFVDERSSIIYLLKTTTGFSMSNNYVCAFWNDGTTWHQKENPLSLGSKIWLGNNNSIDVCSSADWSERAVIFGEYGTTTDGTTYALWKSTNNGTSWKKVLELGGDSGGKTLSGEIRHWHTVQADPYTKHWWATSGDGNSQCRIYRSTDKGNTWELLFSGSQRERTCCFVFDKDCIYYGMDSTNNWDENSIKIVKIDRSKLETDRENCREDVAAVDSAFAVYGLSRTYYPDGFLVWSQQEPGASYTPGRYILQFYDYATKKLYPVAYFDTSAVSNSKYIGFYAGSRVQNAYSDCIFAKPTVSIHGERYGESKVSSHIKINLTM